MFESPTGQLNAAARKSPGRSLLCLQQKDGTMVKGKTVGAIVAVIVGLFALTIASCGGLLFLGFRHANATASPRIDALLDTIQHGTFADTYDSHLSPDLRHVLTQDPYADLGQAPCSARVRVRRGSVFGAGPCSARVRVRRGSPTSVFGAGLRPRRLRVRRESPTSDSAANSVIKPPTTYSDRP